jgi:hypothetical protein
MSEAEQKSSFLQRLVSMMIFEETEEPILLGAVAYHLQAQIPHMSWTAQLYYK